METIKQEGCNNSLSKTGLVYDERMAKHKRDNAHPEAPARIVEVIKELESDQLLSRCRLLEAREATKEELLSTHSSKLINEVEGSAFFPYDDQPFFDLSVDTYTNSFSAVAARLAVGGLIDLTDKVVKGDLSNGFAVIRPPGHHACKSTSMGFCLFNNVTITARVMQHRYPELTRIAIMDWDVHHGNGTQELTFDDDSILYCSIHRSNNGYFYPGTGLEHEVGTGNGLGFTVNLPLHSIRTRDSEYLTAFKTLFLPIIQEYDPQLILVSAGFDSVAGDPIGELDVSAELFGHLTLMLQGICSKLVLALEGGYDPCLLSKSVSVCIAVLLGDEPPALSVRTYTQREQKKHRKRHQTFSETLIEVRNIQSEYWSSIRETCNGSDAMVNSLELDGPNLLANENRAPTPTSLRLRSAARRAYQNAAQAVAKSIRISSESESSVAEESSASESKSFTQKRRNQTNKGSRAVNRKHFTTKVSLNHTAKSLSPVQALTLSPRALDDSVSPTNSVSPYIRPKTQLLDNIKVLPLSAEHGPIAAPFPVTDSFSLDTKLQVPTMKRMSVRTGSPINKRRNSSFFAKSDSLSPKKQRSQPTSALLLSSASLPIHTSKPLSIRTSKPYTPGISYSLKTESNLASFFHNPRFRTNSFDGAHRSFDGVHRSFDGAHRSFDGAHRSFDGAHRSFDGVHRSFDGAHRSFENTDSVRARRDKIQIDYLEQETVAAPLEPPSNALDDVLLLLGLSGGGE